MKIDVQAILAENKKRNEKLDAFYDPIAGIGGPLERFKIRLKDVNETYYLPIDMQFGEITSVLIQTESITEAAETLNTTPDNLAEAFIRERFVYDFEFWAYTCIKILSKDEFEEVPFKLRGAQRTLLYELELMRLAGVPIRIVLLKARQWGGSTLVQIYMMWIQQIHKRNWHLAVVAQDDNAARNVSGMYDMAAQFYPEQIGTVTFAPYKKSTKNIRCIETGGIIGVGSANKPNQFRSYNRAMAHLTEVGVWEDTPKRSAKQLVASLKESIPDIPYSMVVEESTANGLNYFYDSWKKAVAGKTRYKAVFIPWWQIDRDRVALDVPVEEFLESMDDYHWYLWELGATLEGINWYIKHKADKGYSDWMMMQENPSTPEEAFQSSGKRVFPPVYVQSMRRFCEEPVLIGDVFAKARVGKDALKDIEFHKSTGGKLWVWKTPEEAKKLLIRYRYAAFVDIGGKTDDADYSCVKLIDREPMTYGEDPEVVCVWHGHLDQDLLAWKAAQICKAYAQPEIDDYPLLAFEIQSLKKKETEGDHSLTILDTIKDHYPNLYIRNDNEKVGSEWVPKYGFHTNTKTKGMIINSLNACLREKYLAQREDKQDGYGYIEKDSRACDEMSYYEVKDDGSLGAIQGKHDDHVIVTAGSVWLAISKMPPPEIVQIKPKIKVKRKKRTYSSF